ncbi:MAG: thioesterase family protein [Acidobacteriota bacterium]|nr:thioesterase family protein [Acidobacteriota bacterium]
MTTQPITRDQFRYWKTIEVRWGDMDAQGHVNNTVYFVYCESARVELLRKIGYKGKQAGMVEGPSLVHASCDFKRQVIYPAKLDVGLRVDRISQRSFKIVYGIFFHGTDDLAATATSINAWANYAESRSVELPKDIQLALAEYQ